MCIAAAILMINYNDNEIIEIMTSTHANSDIFTSLKDKTFISV